MLRMAEIRGKRQKESQKNKAEKQIAIAKQEAWEMWSRDLATAEGRQMFKVAKRNTKLDVAGMIFIEDEDSDS